MSARSTASADGSLPDPLPLVGRAEELATLEAILENDEGGTSAVFLHGDGGVGKSRLAQELADRATRRSWRVARGRAYPVETGVPYAIFADAWLPILREMDTSTLNVLTRGGVSELRYLFPALDSNPQDADPLGVEDPEEFRTRLMWNFAGFVKSLASREPILCVLEDLQWADESSLQLVHFLARQTAGARFVLLCTYNDQERERRPQLIQAERSLASLHVADVLQLQPLSLDEVAELVRRTFGVDGDSVREFSAVLYGWTQGNPFFAEEIVKSLVATDRIRLEAGTWVGWDAKDFGMPRSLRDAVVQRVGSLSESAQTVAELAAVIGTRTRYALLESISGLGSGELIDALEELCAHRILNERSEEDDLLYLFVHPLVRQILYGEFGLARARMLHGAVAEAMEAYYGSAAVDHADELAFHFTRAGGAQLRGKAARYLAAAGRRALDRRADLEAVKYLTAALQHASEQGADPDASAADLVQMLARAHTHLGHFEEAAALLSSTLERTPDGDPARATLRRVLGMTRFWCGAHEEAHLHFDAGLELARAEGLDTETVRLSVAKAHVLHELGRAREALDTLALALPLADRLGDSGLLARVHRALALVHVWVGPPEEAEAHAARAIALAREVGDAGIEFWARWGLAVLTGMRGETSRMAEAIQEVNALADRLRSPVLRLWTADMSVELAFSRGDWDAGIAEGDKAISEARALNQRMLLPRLLVWTSRFHVVRGNFERAAELVAEAEEISGLGREDETHDVHQIVPTYIGKAHLQAGMGDFPAAIESAERGLEIAEGTGYVLWALHHLLPILGEACLWAEEIDRAREAGARLRAHAKPIDHKLGLAWADAGDALVQWKGGDSAGSIDPMRAALEKLEEVPMIWYAARLRRQVSARLWEAGRPEESRAELDEVWALCVRLGADPEKKLAREDYRTRGWKPPTERRSDGPLGLTPEELEVAKLLALGMSNPQIAEARSSSVRTVSTHLSNIYKKLEIGGSGARMRLANVVRDADLIP